MEGHLSNQGGRQVSGALAVHDGALHFRSGKRRMCIKSHKKYVKKQKAESGSLHWEGLISEFALKTIGWTREERRK